MGIAGILIIMAALAALAVVGIFAITHYAGYTKARLLHAQEMIKLRETSDENAHRRYIEMRKLEDHLAQPGSIREIELEAAHAEARAREAAATESLEKYRERELHRHRY